MPALWNGTLDEYLRQRSYRSGGKDACWPWRLWRNTKGYGVAHLRTHGGRWYAHRLAYVAAFGEIPESHHICHRCDNPSCVNPRHLFVGTASDNVADCVQKGRHRSNPNSIPPKQKLVWADVRQIRAALKAGEKQASLAHRFGVSKCTISHIACGRTWHEAS